ncbi:SET domain-containing protein RMS1 [Sodiomyces alkalinus F11]|uniref:SET domain-containing protein RMS1 n=1 Tax=Sodiomyces alkalinus (strain CBS 110278 / VKM F-3762 / F11) TaxID=1314773 RepID=A0A3N2PJ68_SODAK|nr:SET domain-containing protein RMS1 [Sodiomyces alkalinus F11]ROT34588.1 SET domain-containing protein RMS1 [Sodiomyces alkalinus F11]
MGEFQATSDRFLAWFKSVGGQFREELLQIVDSRHRGAGRGIVATKDIPQETALFTIPRHAIINVLTSELPKKLPGVFSSSANDDAGDEDEDMDGSDAPDSWGSLILVMLYEYLQGDTSRWKPYFDVLPDQFDTPIFWSDAELKELEGTSLTPEKIGKQESDAMLRSKILPVVLQNASVFYPEGAAHLGEDELLRLAHRMGSTIMAYAFDLDNDDAPEDEDEDGWVEDREGQTMLGMVPMADTLNANAEFNAHVNHGEALEVTAIRSTIQAGSEILNYYGPLPTSELLRRYGYVTPQHQRYDIVDIPWSLVRTILRDHLGLSHDVWNKLQSQMDEDEIEDSFIIERDSGDPDSEGRLTETPVLREISSELDEQIKSFLKALKKLDASRIPDKRKRDDIRNAVVAKVLDARLAQYPTTAQNDEALLARDDLPHRHRMAVHVRLGEKKLLQEAIDLLQSQAQGGLHSENDHEPSSKRPRN